MRPLLADKVCHGDIVDHELISRYEPAGNARYQPLAEDTRKRTRKLNAHLVLLRRREDVDNTVDGLHRVVCVQGLEDQVTGFGGGNSGGDSFRRAHLPYHYHVNILPKPRLERHLEVRSVDAYLALVDERELVFKQIFYRVFDGNNMLGALLIDLFYKRGKRGGLTLSDRPNH